jgi:hypothetical protein
MTFPSSAVVARQPKGNPWETVLIDCGGVAKWERSKVLSVTHEEYEDVCCIVCDMKRGPKLLS